MPARLLHVEVTESMAWLDEEAFIRTLEALRRAGIGLSLDDFGKGYSSLAMLHSFGFDTIKLDRAFLAPGQEKQRSVWIIISSLVDMARRLGIEILCEGVETEDQLQKAPGLALQVRAGLPLFAAHEPGRLRRLRGRPRAGTEITLCSKGPLPGEEGPRLTCLPQMQSAAFP